MRPVFTLGLAAFLVTAVFVFQDCTKTQDNSPALKAVTLSSADSTTIYDALSSSGVTDTTGAVGVTTLKANLINCNSSTSPGGPVTCQITWSGGTLNVSSTGTSAVQTTLVDNGATDGNGTVGDLNTEAFNVVCTLSVSPGSMPSCQMQVL